jgi:hypothetical protein
MIIDRTGKERSHDDFDYRFPEVWVAKIRSRVFSVRGIKKRVNDKVSSGR